MDSEWLDEANAVLNKYEKDPSRAWTATDVLATRAEGKPGEGEPPAKKPRKGSALAAIQAALDSGTQEETEE